MIGRLVVLSLVLVGACVPSNVTPPPDASDASLPPVIEGGTLHAYTCPVGDGGAAWTCQDGLRTPVGTCPSYCVPVAP